MTQEINNSKINWTVVCVNEFARQKALTIKSAFQYLHTFGGLKFLKEHYEAEHLLSIEDVVEDLDHVCQKNGGVI